MASGQRTPDRDPRRIAAHDIERLKRQGMSGIPCLFRYNKRLRAFVYEI